MNHHNSLTRALGSDTSRLVERAFRHWEVQRRAAAAKPDLCPQVAQAFTIALSREAGTQGTAVAQEVGTRLGWHVYDNELLHLIAREMGLRTALLKSVDERQQPWLVETVEAFLSAPQRDYAEPLVSETSFVRHLAETVRALGAHGECVIVGRGATFLLPSQTTLRVRLVGPVPERIEALSRKFGISREEAVRKVESLDRERTGFVRDHFHGDPTDPRNYDLVLNAVRYSTSECAELIIDALRRMQGHCPDSDAVLASAQEYR
jgi:cytidylate kinase